VSWDDDRTRRFLLAHVESFEALELLLALADDPDASWTVQQGVDQVPGSSVHDMKEAVERLVAHRLCAWVPDSTSPRVRFVPGSDDLREGVEAIRQLRSRSPTLLATLMSKNAVERMRAWTAAAFADAFLLGSKVRKTDG
jgi:hypothetical protein